MNYYLEDIFWIKIEFILLKWLKIIKFGYFKIIIELTLI